ncbi:MAG: flagellar motor switch protein FliG, partial [Spirochaetia bacterium]|nr:flagellar motor switch protein FliG [Spirochaetia bacterium]
FAENPLLSMNLEHHLTSMEILTQVDDRGVQKWLRDVSNDELAKALKDASIDVQDKIFRNMSHRAAAMLQEDMEYMGPVRKSDILESQKNVMAILKKLEEDGEIVISSEMIE